MGKIAQIQAVLGVDADDKWGPKSQTALDAVLHSRATENKWPFEIKIVGDDIMVEDVVITCFGGWGAGIADPQDSGETASGMNTRTRPVIGVAIPMDGRQFSNFRAPEHRALDGSPIPRLINERGLTAWHTLVEVTVGKDKFVPRDGIVDLGPGLQASRPGEPHALDLTPLAAAYFKPGSSLASLALYFEARGSYRIIGGAKLMRPMVQLSGA